MVEKSIIASFFRLIFSPSGMAACAVWQFIRGDTFFQVLRECFLRVMFVTVVAGIFHIGGWVAYLAADQTLLAMIQGEAVVLEQGG